MNELTALAEQIEKEKELDDQLKKQQGITKTLLVYWFADCRKAENG